MKIQQMMELARINIPKQLYREAMEYYYDGNLDKAVKLLFEASYQSNDSLNAEIEFKKYIIADEMFNNSDVLIKGKSIDGKISFYNNLSEISNKIDDEVNNQISLLLIQKGDSLINKNKYERGYMNYVLSLGKYPDRKNIIDIKVNNMITKLLNDIYNFLQNKDYVIAYEHLSFIKDISSNNQNVDVLFSL